MEPGFWHERWALGQIGFHEGAPNRFLTRFAERIADARAVFVPLCGKSTDLDALAARGHAVVGCELVEQAVREYFRERGLEPEVTETPTATLFSHGSVTLARGDVFAFESERAPFDAAFDRAALIALSPEQRERYARKLCSLLAPGARVLLVTMEHDLGSGPPFSVSEELVRALFSEEFSVELLADEDSAESNPRFIERGASYVRERAWLLARKGAR